MPFAPTHVGVLADLLDEGGEDVLPQKRQQPVQVVLEEGERELREGGVQVLQEGPHRVFRGQRVRRPR